MINFFFHAGEEDFLDKQAFSIVEKFVSSLLQKNKTNQQANLLFLCLFAASMSQSILPHADQGRILSKPLPNGARRVYLHSITTTEIVLLPSHGGALTPDSSLLICESNPQVPPSPSTPLVMKNSSTTSARTTEANATSTLFTGSIVDDKDEIPSLCVEHAATILSNLEQGRFLIQGEPVTCTFLQEADCDQQHRHVAPLMVVPLMPPHKTSELIVSQSRGQSSAEEASVNSSSESTHIRNRPDGVVSPVVAMDYILPTDMSVVKASHRDLTQSYEGGRMLVCIPDSEDEQTASSHDMQSHGDLDDKRGTRLFAQKRTSSISSQVTLPSLTETQSCFRSHLVDTGSNLQVNSGTVIVIADEALSDGCHATLSEAITGDSSPTFTVPYDGGSDRKRSQGNVTSRVRPFKKRHGCFTSEGGIDPFSGLALLSDAFDVVETAGRLSPDSERTMSALRRKNVDTTKTPHGTERVVENETVTSETIASNVTVARDPTPSSQEHENGQKESTAYTYSSTTTSEQSEQVRPEDKHSTKSQRRTINGSFSSLINSSPQKDSRTETKKNKMVPPPRPYDVILGRGKGSYNQKGNKRLRTIVEQNIPEYLAATTKVAKTILLENVVSEVMDFEGHIIRFLKNDEHGGWVEVEPEHMREKIGHAMREAIAKLDRVDVEVTEWDVVIGPKRYENHAGNLRFKAIVENHASLYVAASTTEEKRNVTEKVLAAIEPLHKMRFLRRERGCWRECKDTEVLNAIDIALESIATLSDVSAIIAQNYNIPSEVSVERKRKSSAGKVSNVSNKLSRNVEI